MRHLFLAVLGLWVLACGPARAAESRVALVIGIDDYSGLGPGGGPIPVLQNAVSDANAVANRLALASFAVTRRMNVRTKQELEGILSAFARDSAQADIALVYYAGHGIEVDGINYLIPAGAELVERAHVPGGALSVNAVLRSLTGAKQLRIVILDACREDPFGVPPDGDQNGLADPFAGYKSLWDRKSKAGALQEREGQQDAAGQSNERGKPVGRGLTAVPAGFLSQVDSAGSTLIAFPVDPGEIAWDGNPGELGPLAEAIVSTLALAAGEAVPGWTLTGEARAKIPAMKFADFVSLVRDRVGQKTRNAVDKRTQRPIKPQTPWSNRSVGILASDLPVIPPKASRQAASGGRVLGTSSGARANGALADACTARTEMQLREETAVASCLAALELKPDDAEILGRLGVAYLLAARDPASAFGYLNRGAMKGDSRALAWLGELYLKGQAALPADPQRAAALFRRALSAAGPVNPAAQNNLGLLYEVGWADAAAEKPSPNLTPNLTKAAALFRQAAMGCLERVDRACFPPALLNLARMRAFGLGGEKADIASAIDMLDIAARHDYSTALALKGYLAQRGLGGAACDPAGAVRNYKIAAAQSDSYAQALLGQAYELGIGGLKTDLAVAGAYFRKSAADGNPYGQAYLARLYARSGGAPGAVEQDFPEALRLLKLAIAQGNPVAKSALARLMETGAPGVPKDSGAAMDLYRQAAAALEEDALAKVPAAAAGIASSCR